MKQFLPLMILLAFFSQVNAQSAAGLLINESFESYSNTNLNGQGGWSATGNDNYVQVAGSSPLSYTGYVSGSKYASLVQRNDYINFSYPFFHSPDDPTKGFIGGTSLSGSTSTTFFMSFLVKVPSASGTESTNDARPTVALRTSSGDNLANFYIADNGSNVKFGIKKDGTADGQYDSGNYSVNSTYLIVIRYDMQSGSGSNDRMYLWINPSLSGEPNTSTANVTISGSSGISDGGFSGNVSSLQLFQQEYSATALLDAFKVSYARNFSNNPAAAWEALSPGAAPLPVTFGEIKGYKKENGVQLDWTVHTEINVSRYEVERSTDGVSFSKTGSVTAQAKDGVLYYTYFDALAAAGVNFYRVKNVDLDDKYTYSAIVKISTASATAANAISVYPNPVYDSRVNLQMGNLAKGDYMVEVFNSAGQQVLRKSITHSGGAASHSIQLPATVKTGIYNIRVSGTELKMTKQFLVQ